jgi:hypothetical protein
MHRLEVEDEDGGTEFELMVAPVSNQAHPLVGQGVVDAAAAELVARLNDDGKLCDDTLTAPNSSSPSLSLVFSLCYCYFVHQNKMPCAHKNARPHKLPFPSTSPPL